MSNEIARQECINRMKKLKMHENVISDFENGKLNYSIDLGALYWVKDSKVLEKVKELEEKYNITIYHLIHHNAEFGECWCFLYVENEVKEYKYDNEMLEDNLVYAYVWNLDDDYCSEFGAIMIKSIAGGLLRIG